MISVVVCTFNRVDLLRGCLESLIGQSVEPREVIVVNNNSTDETATWLEEFIQTHPLFNVVFEPKQGLSHARNAGLVHAKGRYIAYLDDDGVADPNWVRGIQKTIEEVGEEFVAFGSAYFPFYQDSKPKWFADRFGTWYGGPTIRSYMGGECICGGNMVLRKDILESVGGFSPDFGMRGTVRSFGEESEVHLKLKKLGLKTCYSPYFPIRHLVKKNQLVIGNLLLESFRTGRNAGQLGLLGESKTLSFLKVSVTLILFPYYFLRYHPTLFLTRVIDALLPVWRRTGYLRGLFDRSQ